MNATDSSARNTRAGYAGSERRSAPRRRLQDAVQVRLSGGKGADSWGVHGLMLNATPRGMACRVRAGQLGRLPAEGGAVKVSFDLNEEGGPTGALAAFELAATVRSLTQAGTAGYYVVGMEFNFNESVRGERERLRAALEAVSAEGGAEQAL